jgi:hypothetical protein
LAVAHIHARMPVILPREGGAPGWARSQRASMSCKRCPSLSLPRAYLIGTRENNVKNDDA